MKKLFILLLVLVSFACLTGCNDRADVTTDDTSDAGKQDIELVYTYENALALIEEKQYEHAYYVLIQLDRQGDERAKTLLEDFHVVFTKCIRTNAIVEYEYDEHGYMLCRNITYGEFWDDTFRAEKTETVTAKNTYDDAGRIIRIESVDEMGYTTVTDHTYFSSGYTVKETHYGENGYYYTYEKEYDSAGRLIKKAEKTPEETVERKEWVYDENGNLLEENYWEGEELVSSNKYEYDEKNRAIKNDHFRLRGESKVLTYVYVDTENSVSCVCCENGEFSSSYEKKYDQNGKLTEQTNDLANDISNIYPLRTVYSYDSEGRLAKKEIEQDNGERITVTYSYDENGILIKEESTNHTTGKSNYTKWIYDDSGRLIQKEDTSTGHVYYWEYDEYGQLVMYQEVYEGRTTHKYEYSGIKIFYRPNVNDNLLYEEDY